ncbi:MAG: rod shape-determining protein RodA, partial [Alphaproteobacteria bacterium]|nr:rod shape-determining protein RodA [Alphaproteobacteria bacterium]
MSFFKDRNCYLKDYNISLPEKILRFNYLYLVFACLVVMMSITVLYSIAGGSFYPWAFKQTFRFVVSLMTLYLIAMINLRLFMKYAYVIYGISLCLLIAVSLFGHVGMGAQRWLNLGFFMLQPSEVMKIALILALARYFHGAGLEEIRTIRFIIPPLLMMAVPVLFILKQPDLGTALMLVFATGAVFYLVGVQIWKFIVLISVTLLSFPLIWSFLHDYQKKRVLTFLNPESDPTGAGYHITQSKITLGSGGVLGKGFLQGTQSRLSFIPEKQTDFILTVLCEEFGLIGALVLCILYGIIIGFGFYIAHRCVSFFGKILAIGLTVNFALYVFINMAMVMGLMPVVGVPLPLMSYGGTAMLTLFIGFGMIESVHINRDMVIGRRGS